MPTPRGYKILIFTIGIIIVLFCIPRILGWIAFSGLFDKHVTREETVKNFADHEQDIMFFSDLFMSKRPSGHEVFLSLNGNKGSISIGLPSWAIDQRFPGQHFEFNISDVYKDSALLKEIGWNESTFKKIVDSFRKTNCASAQTNDDVVNLGYRTGTWTSYSYFVNSRPISDSLRKIYNSDGLQILNNRVVIGRSTAL